MKISLSTDGGLTFPTVLAASTPNDGSQAVLLPNITTTTARIKVEAVGNYFFDVNDANFTIQPAAGNVAPSWSTPVRTPRPWWARCSPVLGQRHDDDVPATATATVDYGDGTGVEPLTLNTGTTPSPSATPTRRREPRP